MGGGITDGDQWIGERLRFLRERLTTDLSESERQAVEAEIEVLSSERGLTARGLRTSRLLRRLRRR
ncbi:MAG: hypothetical protein ACR2HV_02865 [Acidimicrobiales bacterium]